MATYIATTAFIPTFLDDNGDPLNGGTLESYIAGTTTPTPTFTGEAGVSAGDIITLNARGEPETSGNTHQVWIDSAIKYDFVLKTAAGVIINSPEDVSSVLLDSVASTLNIASAKALTGLTDGQSIYIRGYYAAADGGGGMYVYDASSAATANDGTVLALDSLAGRLLYSDAAPVSTSTFGTVGDGVVVDTAALTEADTWAASNTLIVKGDCLFTGQNLVNTANYIFAEGASIVDVRGQQIVMLDTDNKTVIGLQHNHLLENETTLGTNAAITSGNINTPPRATPYRAGSVDVLAYWYQDFGIDYTRDGNGANGSLTWYYWSWNFATNTGNGVSTATYSPDRRPSLGYYRGDDVNVLGWQCYWLAKYGTTGVILQPRVNTGSSGFQTLTSTWSSTTDVNHWMYQLFTNTPNFSALQYEAWGFSSFLADTAGNRQIYIDSWTEVINNIYLKYPNFHYIERNGEVYPAMFLFEGSAAATTFGNNADDKETKDFYISMAALFKAAGYAGVALLCRNPTASHVGDSYLESNGVLYLSADYSQVDSSGDITDYEDYLVDSLDFNASDRIRGVCNTITSRRYVYPHPSTAFLTDGYTPDLFRQAVAQSLRQIAATDAPKILTVYNVSEWAEGGPSLQPNVQDGFQWLEALLEGVKGGTRSQAKGLRSSDDSLLWKAALAGSQRIQNLDPNSSDIIRVSVDFSTDEISDAARLPNINTGLNGQVVTIMVTGSNTLRLVDDIVTSGTKLKISQLGGGTGKLTLAPNQTATFAYDVTLGLWVCISTTGTPT